MTKSSIINKRNKRRRARYKSVKDGLSQNYRDRKASLQAFTTPAGTIPVGPKVMEIYKEELAKERKKLAQHLKRMLEGGE